MKGIWTSRTEGAEAVAHTRVLEARGTRGFRVVFDGGGSSLVMARWTRVGSLARLGWGHSLSCRLARSLSHFFFVRGRVHGRDLSLSLAPGCRTKEETAFGRGGAEKVA